MKRGAPFAPGLGQDERAAGKIERGERRTPGACATGGLPVQPAGDHQMNDQPNVALQTDGDAFADAADLDDDATFKKGERRIERAQDEGLSY